MKGRQLKKRTETKKDNFWKWFRSSGAQIGLHLCALQAVITEFETQFLNCVFSLIQRENWISRDFFCAEQFCKSCLCTSSFCQAFSLRKINCNHIKLNPLDKDSVPLRSWHNPGSLRNPGSLYVFPQIFLRFSNRPLICCQSTALWFVWHQPTF